MKLLTVVYLLLCSVISSYSQQMLYSKLYFNSTVWNTMPNDVVCTHDNHFLIAGWAYLTGGDSRYSIIKTNDSGDTLWFRTDDLNRPLSEARIVKELSNGDYLVASTIENFYDSLYIAIYDQNGNLIQRKSFGDSADVRVATFIESQGNLFFFCQKQITTQNYTTFIVKTDLQGNLLGTFNDTSFTIRTEGNNGVQEGNNFVLCGVAFDSSHTAYDPVVVKLDSTLQQKWLYRYPTWTHTSALQIAHTSDNGFAFTTINPEFLIKIDSSGSEEWRMPLNYSFPSLLTTNSRILISTPELLLYWYNLNGTPIDTVSIPLSTHGIQVDKTIIKGDTLIFVQGLQNGQAPIYSSTLLTLVRDTTYLTTINAKQNSQDVSIYPSILQGHGIIHVSGLPKGKFHYSLIDLNGSLIIDDDSVVNNNGISTIIDLNTKSLNGIYFLSINSKNLSYRFKIIVL